MSHTRSYCKTAIQEHFFFPLKDPPAHPHPRYTHTHTHTHTQQTHRTQSRGCGVAAQGHCGTQSQYNEDAVLHEHTVWGVFGTAASAWLCPVVHVDSFLWSVAGFSACRTNAHRRGNAGLRRTGGSDPHAGHTRGSTYGRTLGLAPLPQPNRPLFQCRTSRCPCHAE